MQIPPPFAVCPRQRLSPERTPEGSGFSRHSGLSDGLGQPARARGTPATQAIKTSRSGTARQRQRPGGAASAYPGKDWLGFCRLLYSTPSFR